MSTITEIKQAILGLCTADRAAVRDWLIQQDAAEWDCQFEDDVNSGRLDWLKAEALKDLQAGRCADR